MAILLNELIKIQKQYNLTIKSGYISMTFITNKKTQEKKNTSVELKEEHERRRCDKYEYYM